jgi:hypothetical protein
LTGLNRIYIILFVFLLAQKLHSQWNDSTRTKDYNYIEDTIIHDNPDQIKENFFEKNRSDKFYDSLEIRANKYNWSRELHNLILRPDANTSESLNGADRSNYFQQFEGKFIRKILLKQLEIFGPSITDTTREPRHWIESGLNSISIPTNKRYLENHLLIEPGEKIDPFILADNERILRSVSSLQDVRIYLVPVEGSEREVDVLVLTKDVMALGLSWEIYDIDYGTASIWNTNMLGLGHNIKYTAYYNLNREPKYGYDINYRINNISHSFSNLIFTHVNRREIQNTGIKIERNFFTPAIRIGGAASYSKVRKLFALKTIDTTINDIVTRFNHFDVWAGYSIPIRKSGFARTRRGYFITYGTQIYNYFERPEVTNNYLHAFHKRTTFLSAIGLTWQGYHTTRLVYGFGNTEDLPFGAMIKLTGGMEQSEFINRPYTGTTINYSVCVKNLGYFSHEIDFGAYYNNGIEQGALHYDFLHISRLMENGRHSFRNFLTLEFVQGINRYEGEYAIINEANRVKGINPLLSRSRKRLYVNNEFVYYSPHYVYGFRLLYYWFTDAGMVNSSNHHLFHNPLYVSTGIGIRIRNERLVLNTVQIQFTLFPLKPGLNNNQDYQLNFTSFPQYRMPEFADRKPDIIEY